MEELDKISHREYSTGFYFGHEPGQVYHTGGYVRHYDVIAVCESWENGILKLLQRNRFFRGDVADVLEPGEQPFDICLDEIYDEKMNPIESAPPCNHDRICKMRTSRKTGGDSEKKPD